MTISLTIYFYSNFIHKLCHFDLRRNHIIFATKLLTNILLFPYNEKSYFLTLCDFSLRRNDNYYYLLIILMFLEYFTHKLCHFDVWRNLIIFATKLLTNILLFMYKEKSYFLTLCDFSLGRNDNFTYYLFL